MNPALSPPYGGSDAGRRNSRLAACVTGTAVLSVCVAYAGWSLLPNRPEEVAPADTGIALAGATDQAPELLPAKDEPTPAARLTLDEGTDLVTLPVTNAHLEVPADGLQPTDIAPAVEQLGFTSPSATRPPGAVGAWLTGNIESSAAPP